MDVDLVEETSGLDEIVESTNCVYWAGYPGSDEDPDNLCRFALSELRIQDPDVFWVKIKTRSGETVADCR